MFLGLFNEIRYAKNEHDGSGWQPSRYYKAGDEVTVTANPAAGRFFREWKIKVIPKGEHTGPEITDVLVGDRKGNSAITFTMPDSDDPGSTHSDTQGNSAGTGDDANILGWIILLMISLLAMSSIILIRRRRKE